MRKLACLLLTVVLTVLNAAPLLTTSVSSGSRLAFDDYGVVSEFTVGLLPPYTPYSFLDYSSTFLAFNGGIPLEVSSVNAQIWNNNPIAPYPGAFFIPGIYENWTYANPASTNVWSNVIKYQSGDINYIGGIGYKLTDPSPTLGAPFVDWTPICQLTNCSPSDLKLKMYRYFRPITSNGGIFYSNHGSVYDYDYDNSDGTTDDFAHSFINGGSANMYFGAGYPIDRYRIQSYTNPTIYNSLINGAADYNLTNKTDPVYANTCEFASQYKEYTLKQDQSLLYWIMPKPILINNSAANHPTNIAYLTKELSSTGTYDFAGTNTAINYSALTFKTNGNNITANKCNGVAVEITGGMVTSPVNIGLNSVYTNKYWEVFYDTRRFTSTANLTFTYPDDPTLTSQTNNLRLAYRTDYDQNWSLWNNFAIDVVNRKITANNFTGGDAHWAVAFELSSGIANNNEKDLEIISNYPNPFNNTTTISYFVPSNKSAISLTIYDVKGQIVNKLIDNQVRTSGCHTVSFNAAKLSSGIYNCVYSLDNQQKDVRKLILLK